ncbi:hypothetical protein GGR51DRAFT_533338 [Nemania sp. FL0031]|nr:hypothetical protein GGR51DRAFT_533338 [Nemania sp. FL0031]
MGIPVSMHASLFPTCGHLGSIAIFIVTGTSTRTYACFPPDEQASITYLVKGIPIPRNHNDLPYYISHYLCYPTPYCLCYYLPSYPPTYCIPGATSIQDPKFLTISSALLSRLRPLSPSPKFFDFPHVHAIVKIRKPPDSQTTIPQTITTTHKPSPRLAHQPHDLPPHLSAISLTSDFSNPTRCLPTHLAALSPPAHLPLILPRPPSSSVSPTPSLSLAPSSSSSLPISSSRS